MNMHNELLFDKTLTFEIIHWIKETADLPVLVKGILRPDDAAQCLENKADVKLLFPIMEADNLIDLNLNIKTGRAN